MERKLIAAVFLLSLVASCKHPLSVVNDFDCHLGPWVGTCWSDICSQRNLEIDVLKPYKPIRFGYWYFKSKVPLKDTSPYIGDNYSEAYVIVSEFESNQSALQVVEKLRFESKCDTVFSEKKMVIVVDEIDNHQPTVDVLSGWSSTIFEK